MDLLLHRRRMMLHRGGGPQIIPLDYLESSGTQHILSTVYGTEDVGFEVKFRFYQPTSPEDQASASVLGSRIEYNDSGLQFSSYSKGNVQVCDTLYPSLGISSCTDYVVRLEGNKVYVNGAYKKTVNTTAFRTPTPLYLFACYQNGSIREHLIGRIYYAKFFSRTTGNLIASYIPVRVGSTGYMYDEVSGTLLGNSGTGLFIVPPSLPQEYQRVSYIQANEDSYIDTGFVPSSNNVICEQTILFPSSYDYNIGYVRKVSGSDTHTLATGCNFTAQAKWQLRAGGGSWNYASQAASRNTVYFLQLRASNTLQQLYVDGTRVLNMSTSIDLRGMDSFWLALTHVGYAADYSSHDIKIYGAKIYDNDVLVRNFVPCKRISDNEAGLFDLVNNVFYASGGTSFTAGPND